VTRREAIEETLKVAEPYLRADELTDAQAAKIGRTLYANLKQAREDSDRQAVVETIEEARPLLRKPALTDEEAAQIGRALHTNLTETEEGL
jgi:arsenate reductase-like glutaredoxin family protein